INSGTTTLPNATHNVFYSTTLTGSGGKAPYRFEILSGGLPAGISLSSAGVISGTTGAPGTYHVTVEVLDSSSPVKTGTMALSLTVS
ncbi:MAG TPA: putative Ig domain-containing protein, partial [Acidimicrobiales bacterium]